MAPHTIADITIAGMPWLLLPAQQVGPGTEVAPSVTAELRVSCQLEQACKRLSQLHDLLQQAADLGSLHGVSPELQELRRLTDLVEQLREPLNTLWRLRAD